MTRKRFKKLGRGALAAEEAIQCNEEAPPRAERKRKRRRSCVMYYKLPLAESRPSSHHQPSASTSVLFLHSFSTPSPHLLHALSSLPLTSSGLLLLRSQVFPVFHFLNTPGALCHLKPEYPAA